jgi:arylsulfatase A-like enzyme
VLSRRQFLAAAALQFAPRPNIVFICSDDHHYQCLGAAGNPHISTPNLDKLASRGVNFTHGIVSTPQCGPSRGVLLSGLESYQSGLRSNGALAFNPGLGPTVVEQLRRSGYATHLVGKWHITDTPQACGFSSAPLWLRGGASKYVDPLLRHGIDAKDEPTPGHITELLSTAAVDVIRAARGPYLLWLAYNAPHTPWTALDAYRPKNPLPPAAHPKDAKPFDWSTYYAVISHMDAQIGRVINAIEISGQWDNTLVVFLGDNGYLCGTKGLTGKVRPWEESIRVPYIVSGGLVKAHGKDAVPVASVDLPATFLDYATVKPAAPLAGASLKPILSGGRPQQEHAYASWTDGRVGALSTNESVEPYRLVRTRFYKYIVWESGRQALYEFDKDPGEVNNLLEKPSALHKQVAAEMRGALLERAHATADPFVFQ